MKVSLRGTRCRRVIAGLAAFLLGSSAASALTIPSSCETALRRALDADAAWRMERRLPQSERTLVSTGLVSCAANQGIIWEVRHPFPSSVTMTTNAMIFVDDEGRRVKPLAELPHYEEIRRQTDAFLARDPAAFANIFEVSTTFTTNGTWVLTFKPTAREMRHFLSAIELHGDATLDKAVLLSGDGGSSTITFTELGRKTHALWKDTAP